MTENFVLRMYNIPSSKTENDFQLEMTKVPIQYQRCVLSSTPSVNDAKIYFETQEQLDEFASYFQKLRRNIVVYKEL